MKNRILIISLVIIINNICCALSLNKVREINNLDFYKLKKIVVNESGIYILDIGNTTIFHYLTPDSLIGQFLRAGQGPGEAVEPQDIVADNDTIYVLGHTQRRIIKFVNHIYISQFKLKHNLPSSFTKIDEKFVVNFVMDKIFMSIYNLAGNELMITNCIGAAQDNLEGSPVQLFSMITQTDSYNGYIYLSYLYKNRIEKYDLNFKQVKSCKIKNYLEEPFVTENRTGNRQNYFINGNEISKRIQCVNDKLALLWQNQPVTVSCKKLNVLSVFDLNLNHIDDYFFEQCVCDFYIYGNKIFCLSNEPKPVVFIYEITFN